MVGLLPRQWRSVTPGIVADETRRERFVDDFESGSLATNWPTRTGGVSCVSAAAHAGDFGARIAPAGAAAHLATSTGKWAQAVHTWCLVKFWLRINTLAAAGTTDIVFVQNALQTNNFDLFVNTDGNFRINLTHGTVQDDMGAAETGRWYRVQCRVFYGDTTYLAQVRVDDDESAEIADASETASHVRSLHFGITTAATYSFDIDDVEMLVSTNRPSFEVAA